ncbi:MAG: hypothetical protein HMLKMBBP_02594 [Planctomycetes bacterium]|nr:hypothetical protein [Planctomycetota bacterium]
MRCASDSSFATADSMAALSSPSRAFSSVSAADSISFRSSSGSLSPASFTCFRIW